MPSNSPINAVLAKAIDNPGVSIQWEHEGELVDNPIVSIQSDVTTMTGGVSIGGHSDAAFFKYLVSDIQRPWFFNTSSDGFVAHPDARVSMQWVQLFPNIGNLENHLTTSGSTQTSYWEWSGTMPLGSIPNVDPDTLQFFTVRLGSISVSAEVNSGNSIFFGPIQVYDVSNNLIGTLWNGATILPGHGVFQVPLQNKVVLPPSMRSSDTVFKFRIYDTIDPGSSPSPDMTSHFQNLLIIVSTDGVPSSNIGGPHLGGEAIVRSSVGYQPSGGIHMGGSAIASFQFANVRISGKAGVRATYNTSMSGGISMGGQSAAKIGHRHVMSGGVAVSGQAITLAKFFREGTGGVAVGGKAEVQASYNTAMTGGMSLSGRLESEINFHYDMTGGITVGGIAAQRTAYKTRMTGGIAVSGSPEANPAFQYTMKGGIAIGGKSAAILTVKYSMTGGISIVGTAPPPKLGRKYTMTGGITMGGNSPAVHGPGWKMTGGISIGGKAALQAGFHYIPEFPHNRIFLYGGAAYSRSSYSHVMNGGVFMGGAAKELFCQNFCNTDIPYYRDREVNSGCKIVDDTGNVQYLCTRLRYVGPVDSRKIPRQGAYVPAATICLERYFTNSKTKETKCSTIIRR